MTEGFRPQRRNANKHTPRGIGMLQRAMETSGYVAPMTAAADGEIIDGSARLDVAADVFDGVEPLVIDHDGKRPIIMRRTDIPNADDPRAVRISLEANRIAAADLEWDAAVLAEILAEGSVELTDLWRDGELDDLLSREANQDDPWEGMPEFEQEDQQAARRIIVHFATDEDVQSFAGAIGQVITDGAKYIWHPYRAPEDLKRWGYRADES